MLSTIRFGAYFFNQATAFIEVLVLRIANRLADTLTKRVILVGNIVTEALQFASNRPCQNIAKIRGGVSKRIIVNILAIVFDKQIVPSLVILVQLAALGLNVARRIIGDLGNVDLAVFVGKRFARELSVAVIFVCVCVFSIAKAVFFVKLGQNKAVPKNCLALLRKVKNEFGWGGDNTQNRPLCALPVCSLALCAYA